MTVYLDGEKKNEIPSTRIRIINLTEAYYKLKIVFADSTIEPIIKYRFELQDSKGYPADRVFIVKKNKKGIYSIHWKSETIWPGYIKPIKENQPEKEKNITKPQPNTTTICNKVSLGDSSFSLLMAGFEIMESDTVKLMAVQQIIKTNCVSVRQVKALMDLFSDETKKLGIAQACYNSTVDKGNYFMLNSEFKNPKNIEELYRSILKE